MKYASLFVPLAATLLLGGCAMEARYADREFGVANRDAFDRQIVYKDARYADKPVEGLDAIYAEHVMGKYLDTYSQGFTKEKIDISEVGIQD